MAKSKAKRRAEEEPRTHKSEHWIIVYNPWHPSHNRRNARFKSEDLQDIGWWLQSIFGIRKVQAIQHKPNVKQVIARIDLDVDVGPKLGCYEWKAFLRNATAYEQKECAKVFEYNYVKYGDQSDKGWEEYFPLSRPHPHNFPVIIPHPSPVWCEQVASNVNWALLIERPPTAFVNSQPEEILHNTISEAKEDDSHKHTLAGIGQSSSTSDPLIRVHGSQTPAAVHASPVSSLSRAPIDSASQISAGSRHPEASPSTRMMDPRILLRTPLGAQSTTSTTAFRPYQTPSHHPLHPSTRPDHAGPPKDLPVDKKTTMRESPPTPALSPSVDPREDKKEVKLNDTFLANVLSQENQGGKVKRNVSPFNLKKEQDDKSTYIDWTTDEISITPGPVSVKSESKTNIKGTQWLVPNGDIMETQLVLIQNPFGIQFPLPGDSSLPNVGETWDWLELIANGALALYFDWKGASVRDKTWTVARIPSDLDLKGVLGRHTWGNFLEHCPREQEGEVSTIIPYLKDPESQGLVCLYAPEARENYERFRVPYPVPVPLLPEDDKADIVVTKRQHDDDIENEGGKRIKLESHN